MGFKIFISADLEGICGVVHSDQTNPGSRDYERACRLMTMEVNAAVEGAIQGGAEEIVVNYSHGSMRNIIIEELHPKAKLITGSPKILSMMAGIDETFDAVFFIGYHVKFGSINAIIDHTISGSVVRDISINGLSVGEVGINAGIAGYYKVPVVLVTGNSAVNDEAKKLLGNVFTVKVKEALGRYSALCLHPSEARELIKSTAKRALENIDSFSPFTFNPPIKLNLTFMNSAMAELATMIPDVRRVDALTVEYISDDYLKCFKALRSMIYLASTLVR
ncbi:MAG: M55 family metallopeptidase [archaeon YNP-WB-062]|jgi:D-amino peptidase|nr:M55 family metallopeptidase [Candidatus Culexarchaeum yellowstonense]